MNIFLVLLLMAIATLWFLCHLLIKEFISLPQSSHLKVKKQLEFVSYTSSEWEENVDKWIRPDDVKNPLESEACRQLHTDQAHFVHDFLSLTCTTRFPRPYQEWCRLDDYFMPIYYHKANRNNFTLSFTPPKGLLEFEMQRNPKIQPKPVVPTERDEHVVSKFVFRDTETGEELVEYIEPLVSHLRFPLAGCLPAMYHLRTGGNSDGFVLTKSYIIPPSPAIRASRHRTTDVLASSNPYHERYLYFDAGASTWTLGGGGSSLDYFSNMWQRHGIVFDGIYAFEATTPADKFYQSVPNLF
jgi:hypothetical protein